MSDASAQQLVRAICACNPCIRPLEGFGLFTVTSMTGMRAHDHPCLCHHHRMSYHLTNSCSTPRVKVRSIATDVTDNEVAEVVCSCGGVPLFMRLVADALACGRLTVQVRAHVFLNGRLVVISSFTESCAPVTNACSDSSLCYISATLRPTLWFEGIIIYEALRQHSSFSQSCNNYLWVGRYDTRANCLTEAHHLCFNAALGLSL